MSLPALNISSFYSLVLITAILFLMALFFIWRKNPINLFNFGGQGRSTLTQFSRDLTELAVEGKLDPVIGREVEIDRVIQVLCRRTKNNPVLVGKSGVGKTAIAEGLAQAIINKKV